MLFETQNTIATSKSQAQDPADRRLQNNAALHQNGRLSIVMKTYGIAGQRGICRPRGVSKQSLEQ